MIKKRLLAPSIFTVRISRNSPAKNATIKTLAPRLTSKKQSRQTKTNGTVVTAPSKSNAISNAGMKKKNITQNYFEINS